MLGTVRKHAGLLGETMGLYLHISPCWNTAATCTAEKKLTAFSNKTNRSGQPTARRCEEQVKYSLFICKIFLFQVLCRYSTYILCVFVQIIPPLFIAWCAYLSSSTDLRPWYRPRLQQRRWWLVSTKIYDVDQPTFVLLRPLFEARRRYNVAVKVTAGISSSWVFGWFFGGWGSICTWPLYGRIKPS